MCQICMKFGARDRLSHYISFLSLGKQPNQACSIKTPHPNDWKWKFFTNTDLCQTIAIRPPLPSVLFLGRDTCLCWTIEHILSSVLKEEFTR